MSLPSTKSAGDKLNPTSLQQQQLEAQLQARLIADGLTNAVGAAVDAGERASQHISGSSSHLGNEVGGLVPGGQPLTAAGGSSSQPGNGESGGPGGVMVPGGQSLTATGGPLPQFGNGGYLTSEFSALFQHYYLALLAGLQPQSSNGGSGGVGGVMVPGGQPLTATGGSSSQLGNGGYLTPEFSALFQHYYLALLAGLQPQSSNGESGGPGGVMGPGGQSMEKEPTRVSLLPSQNRKRGRDSNKTTPSKKQRNDKSLGTCEGPATSAVKSHSKNGAKQKGEFRDKLFKAVEMFFGMADNAKTYLTEEMKNKNNELVDKLSIITGKNDKTIGNISIDEMALAFKEFRECYTEVKGHLLSNDDINSNESLNTLVNKTCDEIDDHISRMSKHDIMQYQEIKENFKSEVEIYKSLGITLPDQEVGEINWHEYTSGANLTDFKTLVDDKINKLKVKYVEKMKVNLAQDVEGYLETISFMDQLKAILKDSQTLDLEETIENLKKFQEYIEDSRMRGKLTVETDKLQPITNGLRPIDIKFLELTPEDLARL